MDEATSNPADKSTPQSDAVSAGAPMAGAPAPVFTDARTANVPQMPEVADPLADEVGLVRPAPKTKSRSDGAQGADQMRDDIAKILHEVKLPEHHDFKALADTAHPVEAPAQVPLQTEPQHAPPMPPPPEEILPAGEKTIAPVHTLKQDLQSVVRDSKMSMVRAVALEQEKTRPEPYDARTAAHPRKNTGIIFASVLLLFLGIAALAGVYLVMQTRNPSPQTSSDSIVFAEQVVVFPLDNQQPTVLKDKLAQARTQGGSALGSFTQIIPAVNAGAADTAAPQQRPATFTEFMTAIGAHPPDGLLRALSDQFFFGIHTVDKNAPLMVIPVTSYDEAFAGMLAWEASMNGDLAPIFTPVPALMTGSDGIPTTRTFTDIVMHNYDVRALKNDAGTIELYYSFPTRNILVIAESPYSFPEILSRLQAGRKL